MLGARRKESPGPTDRESKAIEPVPASLPPIDASAPGDVRTATFALG